MKNKIDYSQLKSTTINGLIFNKYDDRPLEQPNYAQNADKVGIAEQGKTKSVYAGAATGHHHYHPKDVAAHKVSFAEN